IASAGQAQAHSSHPMHFSSPSGHRLSWWWPWNRGAVGFLTSGYSTVSTFRNISWKVTPNPLIGLRKSSTSDLLAGGFVSDADTVVVRQVHRRNGETGGGGGPPGRVGPFDRFTLGAGRFLRARVPRGPLLRRAVPHRDQGQDEHDDQAEDHVRGGGVAVEPPSAHGGDQED